MGAAQLMRLARLMGKERFYMETGLREGEEPKPDQHALIGRMVDSYAGVITGTLVEEAAKSDDVIGAESARGFAEDALDYLGDLITARQRDGLLSQFSQDVAHWDDTTER